MGFLEIVGYIILIAGGITALVGALMFLVAGFRQSGAMGCGMMIPFIGSFIQIYFILTSWDEAKKPLFIQLAGLVFVFLGGQMAGVDLDDELDSDMAAYYEEYYEDYYAEDVGEGEAENPLRGQQRQRIAEREARDAAVEEAPDTFGAESAAESGSSSRNTPQRFVRQDRRASRRERESTAPKRIVGAVPVESLGQHLGRQVTIVKTSGKTVRGKLLRVSADSVTVEKKLGGGKMAFPIPKEDIDSAVLGR